MYHIIGAIHRSGHQVEWELEWQSQNECCSGSVIGLAPRLERLGKEDYPRVLALSKRLFENVVFGVAGID